MLDGIFCSMFYVAEAENEHEAGLLHDFVPYTFDTRCHFSSEITQTSYNFTILSSR